MTDTELSTRTYLANQPDQRWCEEGPIHRNLLSSSSLSLSQPSSSASTSISLRRVSMSVYVIVDDEDADISWSPQANQTAGSPGIEAEGWVVASPGMYRLHVSLPLS